MPVELAVIVPTRGRPENIRKVIGAWDFTNAWDVADLILVADADDPEIGGYRLLQQELDHPDTGQSLVTLIEIPTWVPMVHKLNRVAGVLAASQKYQALAFAGDDHLPQTIGWAKSYLDALAELGLGMVHSDDGYQGANLSTEWAVSSALVAAVGAMVPAGVEHMYCDNSMMDLYGGAGAMKYLPEVRIEHMHPIVGKADSDDQYKRVNHRDQFAKDRLAYERWKREELPGQLATVRRVRQGMPVLKWPATETRSGRRPARPTVARSGRTSRLGVRGGLGVKPPRFFKRVQAATPDDVMMALADFAAAVPADQEIVELGVFHGRTALQMAWGARLGHGAHVTGIDPWDLPGNVYDPPFTDEGSRRWAFHHVVSLGYARDITLIHAFSHDVAAAYDGKPIGLLFVDGDHTKDGARRDIEEWAPYLAPGARIAVDDYGHPDWPGVGEAVDELVAEGFLAPIELYHDRLAVTEIAAPPEAVRPPVAITSEGVSPSPYPAVDGQVAVPPVVARHTEAALVGETETVDLPDQPDSALSTDPDRERVQEGELADIAAGTRIEDLNTVQLRQLARAREIVLGTRKDKRSEMLAALRSGQ